MFQEMSVHKAGAGWGGGGNTFAFLREGKTSATVASDTLLNVYVNKFPKGRNNRAPRLDAIAKIYI